LSWEELGEALHGLLSSGKAAGMEVTIYNPDLDPTGRMGKKFTDVIARAFRS